MKTKELNSKFITHHLILSILKYVQNLSTLIADFKVEISIIFSQIYLEWRE